jgi:hypothetical protein
MTLVNEAVGMIHEVWISGGGRIERFEIHLRFRWSCMMRLKQTARRHSSFIILLYQTIVALC